MDDRARGVAVFSGGGTGGHLYPALALARALREIRPDVDVFFVGARRGLEARVLPETEIPFRLLPVRGVRRGRGWRNLSVLPALARSVWQAGALFRRLRPEVVVVTGGYAGAPAGMAGLAMGIPLVLQEQNSVPGVTTRLLSRWARQVHLAFPEARRRLPRPARSRSWISGNPVRPPETLDREEARRRLALPVEGRVALVVGGSQGSVPLNRLVLEGLRGVAAGSLRRPRGFHLLWSTGPDHLERVRRGLDEHGDPAWIRAVGYLDEMSVALAASDLAVSRAGAMATAEFLAWGLPSVLVPFPHAAANHQEENAAALAAAGAAVHLPQAELDGPRLWRTVTALIDDPEKLRSMASAASARGRPRAAREIAGAVADLLPEPSFRGKA